MSLSEGEERLNRIRDKIGENYTKNMDPKMFENNMFSDEQLIYLVDNFPKYISNLSIKEPILLCVFSKKIDLSKSKEENAKILEDFITNELRKSMIFHKDKIELYADLLPFSKKISVFSEQYEALKDDLYNILENSSDEKIDSYCIPLHVFLNSSIIQIFSKVGIDTIMEFDKKNNNIISKYDFKSFQDIFNYYWFNDRFNDNEESLLGVKNNDDDEPFTLDELNEAVMRFIIYAPKANEKFYKTIHLEEFPIEFSNMCLEKELDILNLKPNTKEKVRNVLGKYPIKYLREIFLNNLLKKLDLENISEQELHKWLEEEIYNEFEHGKIIYAENEPEFIKERYSEFFLSPDAPNSLKEVYYNSLYGELSIKAIGNSKYFEFLKGKSFRCCDKDYEIRNLLNVFSSEELFNIINFGLESLDDIENAQEKNIYVKDFVRNLISKKDRSLMPSNFLMKKLKLFYKMENFLYKYPLKYITAFPDIIKDGSDFIDVDKVVDDDENYLKEWFFRKVHYIICRYIISYSENEPDYIKEKYPEIFLDKDAPEELKAKFYNGYYFPKSVKALNFEDLRLSKYEKFLKNKSFEAVQVSDDLIYYANTKLFNINDLIDFINCGIEDDYDDNEKRIIQERNIALLRIYGLKEEYVHSFYNIISTFPKKIAEKTHCKKYNLSESEFIKKQLDEQFKQEFENEKKKQTELIFNSPGAILYFPKEEFDKINYTDVKEVLDKSGFYNHSSVDLFISSLDENGEIKHDFDIPKKWPKKVDKSEIVLWKMYGFLGYENCMKFFEKYGNNKNVYQKLVNIFLTASLLDTQETFSKFFMKNNDEILDNPAYISVLVRDSQNGILEIDDIKNFHSNFSCLNFDKETFFEVLKKEPEEEERDFYKFAKVFGCFSNEKFLDKNGKETEIFVSQKASTILAKLIQSNNRFLLGSFHWLFDSLSPNARASQEFIRFISTSHGKGIYENLDLLLKLESDYPGIFEKVMSDFDNAKKYRRAMNEDGRPTNLPWEEALIRFYSTQKFKGITDKNIDIADLFSRYGGISQDVFEMASKLREEAEANDIPEHLLGKPLKEESILESINRIRNSTKLELNYGKEMIEDLYKKQFTYEWLSKRAPENGILGAIYCNCCASLKSSHYGKYIADATISAPDVQNLVIRDKSGEIISKGSMYLNKDLGYCVINDFELSEKYKQTEDRMLDGYGGRYTGDIKIDAYKTDKEREEDINRNLIFDAFVRGIHKFIEEYDKQNPDKPIQQINVGKGYNRLKKQIEEFELDTNQLSVPTEYGFEDALDEQYILYKRKTKTKDDGNNSKDDKIIKDDIDFRDDI